MDLNKQLAETKANNKANIPTDIWNVMEESTNKLIQEQLSKNAFQVGDILPNFNLIDIHNKEVSLNDFSDDFLVISFYRGGWCPYCNLELKALQNIVPQLKELNTSLIAITPETPDYSSETYQKNNLDFSVLSDLDNVYAKSLGLVFQMPEELQKIYDCFNIKVDKHNGNDDFELPMPATYVLNKQREIIYSFIPEDYTERLNPDTILSEIKNNNK
ncbi:peroxiredoxin-like family protein [Aureivirga sp. CE67]|uniref:peroxiredoxin-like family protein n=1 Tax=Aureivirga sp. CE67 TaxID=1788983 RepID=UPI0018CB881B|nr:peroxiredoxin-like family protein [Aureivirga sp. CE67]